MNANEKTALKKADFVSDQEVKWCPGCGDYAILAAVQKLCPDLGIAKEKFVFVSGIGCASRFPYYMNTYGFHTIHGRAPAVATGIKMANPDLCVWIISGDGDSFSIGGNHLLHVLRRNPDLNYLVFNNQIYGLTKGQFSPTSQQGLVTKSSPFGTTDAPIDPIRVALGAGATFVARALDRDVKGMERIFKKAVEHKGSSFVEIYQNCIIFNDDAFTRYRDTKGRAGEIVQLRDGEPLIFGVDNERGIVLEGFQPKSVLLSEVDESELLVHDERSESPVLAWLYALMSQAPELPTPMGVFRAVQRPVFEEAFNAPAETEVDDDAMQALLNGNYTWTVS